jgi:hypothetical protein
MINPIDAVIFCVVVFFAIQAAVWLHRLLAPPPPEDLAAITLFLANRGQTPLRMRKGMGGPREYGKHSIYVERLYRVLALDAYGSRYRHVVAAASRKHDIDLVLWQRVRGVWSKVLQ